MGVVGAAVWEYRQNETSEMLTAPDERQLRMYLTVTERAAACLDLPP